MTKKWIVIATIVAVVAIAAAGFGGYTLGVQNGKTQAANIRSNFLASRGLNGSQSGVPGQNAAGGAGFPGQNGGQNGNAQNGGGQFNSANFASGQVKQIDGNTIQLSTANEVLTVKVSDQTRVQKMGDGSLSDVQAGERLSVQGTRDATGAFTATMIQIGGAGGGLGGGNRQQAPGTSGAQQPPATPAAGN